VAKDCPELERKRCGKCRRGIGAWGQQGSHHTRRCVTPERNEEISRRNQLFYKMFIYATYWYFPEGVSWGHFACVRVCLCVCLCVAAAYSFVTTDNVMTLY